MSSGSAWSLVRCPLDWDMGAADALRLVRGDAHPVALTGAWAGGCDIVAAAPAAVCCPPDRPWHALDAPWPAGTAGTARSPGFGGGWIGYLGFGLVGEVLPVPPAPGGQRKLPAFWLGYYDHVLRRERASGRWFFEAMRTAERAGFLDARLTELCARAQGGRPRSRRYACGDFGMLPPADGHRRAVRQAVEYIRSGDVFQANICLRLEAEFDGDPLDAFCAAVSRLDPPRASFVGLGGGSAVASLSPELFLRRYGAAVTSWPIKGTAPRPGDPAQAAAQRASLERSAKNRAENVMIVDLMRNDLSRVCEPGTVRVPRLTAAEPHPGIWHLVSHVTGRLRPGTGDGDLVRATFPPGSVTGAPKVRAIEVIHELEASPREVYTGAIGFRSPLAGLELNVAIRTFEFHGGRVWLGAGGGIVAQSRPADEYTECLLKADPLVRALGSRIAVAGRGRALGGPARAAQLRPRAATGVFTSLLVIDGRITRLGDHLARLGASTRELYGRELPPALNAQLAACLARRPSGRLRITVRPLGGPLRATVEVVPLPGPVPAAVDLHPVVVPGGVGAHKYRDRRLLDHLAHSARLPPTAHLLIEDTDGQILETDRASVFAVTGGVLRTPPADARLLPGVTRAAILKLAADAGIPADVAPLTRHDLITADESFVTNSVHGVVPVRSVAGTTLPSAPGPVTACLSAALVTSTEGVSPPAVRVPASAQGVAGTADSSPTVLVIDNYDSFTYNLVHQLITAGCAVEVVRNDEVTAAQVAAFGPAGIVISPGPCAPQDAGISIEVVRACAGTPVLGVCLGHQAIAACYGARVVRGPRPVHGQTATITHDARGVLAGLPQRFPATRYHSLIVDERTLPPFLAVTARTRGGIPMGLRHSALPVEGVQFHPESVLTSHGQAIIANFVSSVRRLRSPDCVPRML